jgi:hypothetical protein
LNLSQSAEARPVTRSQPLRENPVQPHLAGVLEYNGSLRVLQVLVQDPRGAFAKDTGQGRLTDLDRLSAPTMAQ